jgi:hypothetical protein
MELGSYFLFLQEQIKDIIIERKERVTVLEVHGIDIYTQPHTYAPAHARVRQRRRLPQSTTFLGNVAEAFAHVQSDAALNMGVALTLHVRAGRQGPATAADQAPGPRSHSSASACLNDRVREAAK